MIQDLKLTGCDFADSPILPLDRERRFHLFYVFDGSGVLIADSTSFPCGKDNLFLFPSLEVAVLKPGSRSSLVSLHLTFTCASSSMALEFTRLPRLLPCAPENRALVMEILHECILKRPLHEDLCALYLEQLLIPAAARAARETFPASPGSPISPGFPVFPSFPAPGGPRREDGPLAELGAYIDRHLDQELSLDVLCEVSRMNARQINGLFKKAYHLGTVEYIRSRRLKKARELLCFSQSSVTQIAERTGFKSVHYFSRVFKEHEGISPGEYKKRLSRTLSL